MKSITQPTDGKTYEFAFCYSTYENFNVKLLTQNEGEDPEAICVDCLVDELYPIGQGEEQIGDHHNERFTTEYTSHHTYEYDRTINELRLCWSGDQTYLNLEECYSLLDMLNTMLPARPAREEGTLAQRYAPDGSNYHDHLCRCPGCKVQPPDGA